MTRLFVTATGTGIGKTFVTAALAFQARAAGRRVAALKPILSGFDPDDGASDAHLLLRAQGLALTADNLDRISPWRFAAPLSPHMAAAREGRRLDFDALVDHGRRAMADPVDVLLIEGVGGAFVPVTDDHLVADWIAALGLPALVVAGSYLGTISHTIATVEALSGRGIVIHGIVVSESEETAGSPDELVATLRRHLGSLPVLFCPRVADGSDAPWRAAPPLLQILPA